MAAVQRRHTEYQDGDADQQQRECLHAAPCKNSTAQIKAAINTPIGTLHPLRVLNVPKRLRRVFRLYFRRAAQRAVLDIIMLPSKHGRCVRNNCIVRGDPHTSQGRNAL